MLGFGADVLRNPSGFRILRLCQKTYLWAIEKWQSSVLILGNQLFTSSALESLNYVIVHGSDDRSWKRWSLAP